MRIEDSLLLSIIVRRLRKK